MPLTTRTSIGAAMMTVTLAGSTFSVSCAEHCAAIVVYFAQSTVLLVVGLQAHDDFRPAQLLLALVLLEVSCMSTCPNIGLLEFCGHIVFSRFLHTPWPLHTSVYTQWVVVRSACTWLILEQH